MDSLQWEHRRTAGQKLYALLKPESYENLSCCHEFSVFYKVELPGGWSMDCLLPGWQCVAPRGLKGLALPYSFTMCLAGG